MGQVGLLTRSGFFSRVGNTGIPGVWLFHTGNRYSFENTVPASIGGHLATPPPGGHDLALVIISNLLFLVFLFFLFYKLKNILRLLNGFGS